VKRRVGLAIVLTVATALVTADGWRTLVALPVAIVVTLVIEAVWDAATLPEPAGFTKQTRPPATQQLRVDPNARLFSTRAGFLGKKRWFFEATGLPPERLGATAVAEILAREATRPVPVAADEHRTWWRFEGTTYWENERYDATDVLAVVRDRERRKARKLERARTLLAVDEAPPVVRREAIARELRRAVWERDGGACVECGSQFDIQYDHVIPVARGGATSLDNLQVLCGDCNLRKSDGF
jgi:hypothetical protein